MRLLVTGGAGFIGSNLVRYLLKAYRDIDIVNLDLLTYAGNQDNLIGVQDDPRYRFVHGAIYDAPLVAELIRDVDAVVNLAAESHVDRSIEHDAPFVRTNVTGTHTLLSAALAAPTPPRFIQVSTDEVYGDLPWVDPAGPQVGALRFTESTPLTPRSPYSATKASGDMLAVAYHCTHGLDVVVTRCSNNYGPYQFPEKLIPLMVTNAMSGESLPVYGDGLNVRDWCHVDDNCDAIDLVLRSGEPGGIYNVGSGNELTNLDLTSRLLSLCGADDSSIEQVDDRPGHDRRYSIDTTRIRDLGWSPQRGLDEGLEATVAWYRDNRDWWGPLLGPRP